MNEDFDGAEQIYHVGRGASYGLHPLTYWRLANASMAAKKYGAIEPCEIAAMEDGLGCRVLLYGKAFCFFVEVRANYGPYGPNAVSVSLSALRLDDVTEHPFALIEAAPDDNDTWRRLLNIMLELDGLTADWRELTYEQATDLMRRQGII